MTSHLSQKEVRQQMFLTINDVVKHTVVVQVFALLVVELSNVIISQIPVSLFFT